MLFDEIQDPLQMDNLAAKPEHAARVKELDARLQEMLKQINDDFRPGASYLDEWGYQVAPHGSVGYSGNETQPQTPKRKAGGRTGT
jgi:hypothetical protein